MNYPFMLLCLGVVPIAAAVFAIPGQRATSFWNAVVLGAIIILWTTLFPGAGWIEGHTE